MLMGIFKYLRIVIAVFLALILSRMGISYLIILVALGFILSLISKNKWEGILSGILYATVSYIISYPSGLFLKEFMPNIDIPVQVSQSSVISALFMGWIIPVIIAIVICGCAGIIGKECSKLINRDNNKENKEKREHTFQNNDIFNEEYEEPIHTDRKAPNIQNENMLSMSPIQKAKLRKRRENKEE